MNVPHTRLYSQSALASSIHTFNTHITTTRGISHWLSPFTQNNNVHREITSPRSSSFSTVSIPSHLARQKLYHGSRGFTASTPSLSWYQSNENTTSKSTRSNTQDQQLVPPAPLPLKIPSAKQQRELHAVNTAVVVNCAIFVGKVATWTVTSSGALLAEALHSLADIVNQLLLRAGVQQSRRKPTRQHPYGFHREKYIYSLMSAVSVFCIGAGASVVHGIQSLIDPPALEHMGYNLAILGASLVAETYSLRIAMNAIRIGAKEQGIGILSFLMQGRDPTTAAVLAEDAGAVAGLGIAAIASYLTWVTGDPLYDAVGSISVGMLMGAIAVMLIRNNKRFLIGQAMRPEMQHRLIEHLKADPMVLCVMDPMSEEIGDGVYRFKADIQWSGDRIVHKYMGNNNSKLYAQLRAAACVAPTDMDDDTLRDALDLSMMEFGRGVIRTVGEEIDRLELELRSLCPGLDYVDLETDRGRAETAHAALCYIDGVLEGDEKEMSMADVESGAMGKGEVDLAWKQHDDSGIDKHGKHA